MKYGLRVSLVLGWLGSAMIACAAQTRPAITGIAFVTMYSAHPAAAEQFYGKTLGYTETAGADTIARYGVNRSQWLEVSALPTDARDGLAVVGFTTRNIREMELYLAKHHVAVEERLEEGGFTVRDPEGNKIAFVPPGAMEGKLKFSANATSRRIIHAGFLVKDRGVEDGFFRGLLGFRTYWQGGQTDGRTDYVSLQVPEGSDWLEYMLNVENPDARQLGVMDHFSLGVEHMSDAMAALKKNGCTGADCAKTQMGRDGKVQLNLFDPDLTRVEFMEFKPSGTICCTAFKGQHPREKEDE